jgi:hypothetical protein
MTTDQSSHEDRQDEDNDDDVREELVGQMAQLVQLCVAAQLLCDAGDPAAEAVATRRDDLAARILQAASYETSSSNDPRGSEALRRAYARLLLQSTQAEQMGTATATLVLDDALRREASEASAPGASEALAAIAFTVGLTTLVAAGIAAPLAALAIKEHVGKKVLEAVITTFISTLAVETVQEMHERRGESPSPKRDPRPKLSGLGTTTARPPAPDSTKLYSPSPLTTRNSEIQQAQSNPWMERSTDNESPTPPDQSDASRPEIDPTAR